MADSVRQSVFTREGPSAASAQGEYYSIDVECFATGRRHDARAVGQIALVDDSKRVIMNVYVKPERDIVSYLTPLSGLTKEKLGTHAIPLQQAIAEVKSHLPKDAILVGQNIQKDIKWLGLQQNLDYASSVDLAEIFKQYSSVHGSWSFYSLEHVAKALLGNPASGQAHDAADDAIKSIQLFKLYRRCGNDREEWKKIQEKITTMARPPSFATRYPTFEGVCMGNRKKCRCGASFAF